MDSTQTIIIGAGQAGLATSYWLQQAGHEHLVIEKASAPVNAWRNERWDSFTTVTPNWATRMPGAEYDGPEPDAFMSRDNLVAYFDEYVDRHSPPVLYDTEVQLVEPRDDTGYIVRTPTAIMAADEVVVATGFEQLPNIPKEANGVSPDIFQIPSSQYKNPDQLPPGGVLVVGSAQSGTQIAEELNADGREVYLSVGSAGRAPRRYRGRDIFAWLVDAGFFDLPPEKLPVPVDQFAAPHVSGGDGGHTINLHQFARDGVTLVGHLQELNDQTVTFAPDLHESLAKIDGFESQAKGMIDGYIAKAGLDAPEEDFPQLKDGYDQPVIESLDLKAAGVSSIIWANGFTRDYSMIRLPVTNAHGFPATDRGVTEFEGLYFVGMPWMPSLRSGILVGVGDFSKEIASHIVGSPQLESIA